MGKNKFIKRIVMFIVSILVISSPIFERIIIFMYIYKKRQKRKVDENGKK